MQRSSHVGEIKVHSKSSGLLTKVPPMRVIHDVILPAFWLFYSVWWTLSLADVLVMYEVFDR